MEVSDAKRYKILKTEKVTVPVTKISCNQLNNMAYFDWLNN